MLLTINGNKEEVNVINIIDVVRHYGLQEKMVVIERNGEIVPQPQWAETRLSEGDRMEIVHFVGGG